MYRFCIELVRFHNNPEDKGIGAYGEQRDTLRLFHKLRSPNMDSRTGF